MSEIENYYKLLDLNQQASAEEVRRAYRRLARRLHPDIAGPAGTEHFLRIRAAYETLIDPRRRRAYDQRLRAEQRRARQAKMASAVRVDSPILLNWVSSAKPAHTAEAGSRTRRQRVELKPVHVEIVVSPEMADVGGIVHLDLPVTIVCQSCGGAGRSESMVCPACRGKGRWSDTRRVALTLNPPVRDGQVMTVQVNQSDLPIRKLLVHIRLSWY